LNTRRVHFTLGYALPTEAGYVDFTDDFGLMFGFGAQYIVAEKFAIRADYRLTSYLGSSTGIGVSYCFR
jgi:opacity protein-like surface antigen